MRTRKSLIWLATLAGVGVLVLLLANFVSSTQHSAEYSSTSPSSYSGSGNTSTGLSSNSTTSNSSVPTNSSSSNSSGQLGTVPTATPVSNSSNSSPDFSCSDQHTMYNLPYKQQALLITTPDGNMITIHWDNTTNVDWYFNGTYKSTFPIGFTRDNVTVTDYSHLEYGYNGITNTYDTHTVDSRVAYICSSWHVEKVQA